MNKLNKFLLKTYQIENQESPIILPIDRKGLVKIFRKFGYLKGAEIGVDRGWFSKQICQILPQAKLYGIDAYAAYESYIERKGRRGQKSLNYRYEEAKVRLSPYNCELIKKYSMDAVKDFEDESLDFVFIDGNHTFEYVINDIAEWSKKIRPGGIISGHDFWNSADGFGHLRLDIDRFIKNLNPVDKVKVCQVKDAVLSWTQTNKINPFFVTGADDLSSWFWIKD